MFFGDFLVKSLLYCYEKHHCLYVLLKVYLFEFNNNYFIFIIKANNTLNMESTSLVEISNSLVWLQTINSLFEAQFRKKNIGE